MYYNINFGKVNNKNIINYKKEVKESSILLNFIYRINKNLADNEIMFIYNLYQKNIEQLTKADFEILTNYNNNRKLIFDNFQNCIWMLKKEEMEVLTFDCHIEKYTYMCKIRKLVGSLHFCLYNNKKLIFKERIYYLDDLNRIIIMIKEHNQLEESKYNFSRIR